MKRFLIALVVFVFILNQGLLADTTVRFIQPHVVFDRQYLPGQNGVFSNASATQLVASGIAIISGPVYDASGAALISGVVGTSGGSTASDSAGNTLVNIASWSAEALTVELPTSTSEIGDGLVYESIRQVATNTPVALSDITSGTVAPFWITLRNVGLKTIHYSPGTPTDSSDGIAPGEQIAMRCGTNTPKLNMQSDSTGISTLTSNIWK